MLFHIHLNTVPLISSSFVDSATLSTLEHHKVLSENFNIPRWFWNPLYTESNGFFCASEAASTDKQQNVYNTFFRFLSKHATSSRIRRDSRGSDIQYKWDKLGFCTQWRPVEKSMVLLCFDVPMELRAQMTQTLLGSSKTSLSTTPFAYAGLLLPFIVANFDKAVWACRDLVRGLEQERPDVQNPNLQYVRMHEIARHTTHSTEMLGTSLTVLECMITELLQYSNNSAPGVEELVDERDMNFHRSTLRCLQLRSQALEDRLRNEINLVRAI